MPSAFRNIGVVLSAQVSPYVAGMAKASTATRGLATEINAAERAGKVDYDKLGKAGMVAGGLMVAGFGLAAKAAMDFESTISEVGAVSGATGAELEKLSAAAMKAGAATIYSASEAAKAEAELAKAGVSTADILGGGLTGSLNLAAAGQLDLAKAAEYGANAMNTFGLKGSDVEHISDVLAAAANKSAAEVDDMGQAFAQGGLVAKQMGMGFEETAGTLAMFAQNALKGSDAGTSLKTMLLSLNPKSKEAAALMRELDIDFTDGQGGFKDMAGVAEELKTKLGGLTEQQRISAMSTIFGTDAVRAAALMYEAGGEGVRKWTGDVNDAGYAAELAAKKNDNLKGDIEQLKGSIETGLIEGGSSATGVLRSMTSALTSTVNGMTSLPGPIAGVATGFLGVAGAVTLGAGALTTALPKYQGMLTTLTEMGPGGASAAKGISAATKAAAAGSIATLGLATAWGIWQAEMAENKAAIDAVTASVSGKFKAGDTDENKERIVRIREQIKLLDEDIARPRWLWDADELVATKMFRDELSKTADTEMAVIESDKARAKSLGITVDAAKEMRLAEEEKTKAVEAGIEPTKESTEAVRQLAVSFDDAKKAMTDYYDELSGNTNIEFDLADARADLTKSLVDEGAQMNWMRDEMDITTEKGREQYRLLMETRDAIIAKGQADGEAAGSADVGKRSIEAQTQALRDELTARGYSKAAVDKLIFSLGLVPSVVTTSFETSGYEEAIRQANALRQGMSGIAAGITAATRDRNYLPPFTGISGNARGGDAWAGATRWVGERGPELVKFGQGAHIYDAGTSARMRDVGAISATQTSGQARIYGRRGQGNQGGGGGNFDVVINVNESKQPQLTARTISRELRDLARGQG